MTRYRCEIGRHNGRAYKLIFDKCGHQQACDDEYYHKWYWFLFVDNDYKGNFRTKAEALAYIGE